MKPVWKPLLFFLPVAIAIGGVMMLMRAKKGPQPVSEMEKAFRVRTILMKPMDVAPRALGYGQVVPGKTWQAVSEVSGKVVEIDPRLKKGELFKTGALLFRIDPAAYELAEAQISAAIESDRARLSEIAVQKENTEALIDIEEKAMVLARNELSRKEQLYKKQTISTSLLEQEKMSWYARTAKLRDLKNRLALLPSQKKALEAGMAVNQSRLEDARLNIANTFIKAPFDCRITQVSAETAQFISKGQVIASADGIDKAEITARFPVEKMRTLLLNSGTLPSFQDMDGGFPFEEMGLKALVSIHAGTEEIQWEARVARIDSVMDPKTRTIGVIVVVDAPYEKMIVGVRPPLMRNMFCSVALSGPVVRDKFVIPRSAVHEGFVYISDENDRLRREKVKAAFSSGRFHVLESGVSPGDKVVVSDLAYAIDGMLLDPEPDPEMEKAVAGEAGSR